MYHSSVVRKTNDSFKVKQQKESEVQINVPQATKAVVAKKRRRVKEGKCLLCDSLAKRRGLCFGHYMKFARAKSKLSGVERLEWELQLIASGHILGVQEIRILAHGVGK